MMSFYGLSLFSGAGIGEMHLKKSQWKVVVANELVKDRAQLYKEIHPESSMVIGDIKEKDTKEKIYEKIKNKQIDFILASPPCQGMSLAGKHRKLLDMKDDERNYLILEIIEFIKYTKCKFVLIENVPSLIKLVLAVGKKQLSLQEILSNNLGDAYDIFTDIVDASDYGVPQKRKRAFIRIMKKNSGFTWEKPNKEKKISVKEAIGDLPSLESGEKSSLDFHYARKHTSEHIELMENTPSGCSAFNNKFHYPKKNGKKIKGFSSSYRRIKWDEPAPSITMRSDAISSQRNVHPGRKKKNKKYSDARVLTPREIMILNSMPLPSNINIKTNELLIRRVIGESVPPLLIKKFLDGIKRQ